MNDGFTVGLTGTRNGVTDAQRRALATMLRVLFGKGARALHVGVCVGSDAAAVKLAKPLGYRVVGRPGHIPHLVDAEALALCDEAYPPEDTLERNRKIVEAAAVLVACPEAEEVVRSGTWSCVRAARRKGLPISVVWGDGRVTNEGAWK